MAARLAVSNDRPWSHISLWSLLQYDLVLAQTHCHANLLVVFKYGSALETNSSRFSTPGDFFTYVFFVATIIMVSRKTLFDPTWSPHSLEDLFFRLGWWFVVPPSPVVFFYFFFQTRNLAYLPAQPTIAEAVPGREEDRPCISYSHSFAFNP